MENKSRFFDTELKIKCLDFEACNCGKMVRYGLMMVWWCYDDGMMMLWWCYDDFMMMVWWWYDIDDAMMMVWWCYDEVLMSVSPFSNLFLSQTRLSLEALGRFFWYLWSAFQEFVSPMLFWFGKVWIFHISVNTVWDGVCVNKV